MAVSFFLSIAWRKVLRPVGMRPSRATKAKATMPMARATSTRLKPAREREGIAVSIETGGFSGGGNEGTSGKENDLSKLKSQAAFAKARGRGIAAAWKYIVWTWHGHASRIFEYRKNNS